MIGAGGSFTVEGPINNQGAITLCSSENVNDPATLTIAVGAQAVFLGIVNDTGNNSTVDAQGTETLDNGTLSIGSSDGSFLINYDPGATGATLTFGSALTIDLVGGENLQHQRHHCD